jgi:hypothetical protein
MKDISSHNSAKKACVKALINVTFKGSKLVGIRGKIGKCVEVKKVVEEGAFKVVDEFLDLIEWRYGEFVGSVFVVFCSSKQNE